MIRSLALALLLAAAPLAAAAPAPVPADLTFDGDSYKFAAREADEARVAEHYLRKGETMARFSRRLTVADQLQATSAKAVALGVLNLARMRTPGIKPDTFASESAPESDISVAWYDLLDDNSAVEYHVARFVDREGGGVREYHLTVRRYTNGQPTDAVFGPLRGQTEPGTLFDVERLAKLDRAPSAPPQDKK
jgi:hypothetical protein